MKSSISLLALTAALTAANPLSPPASLEVIGSRSLKSGKWGWDKPSWGRNHWGSGGKDDTSRCPVNGTLPDGYLNPTLMVPVSKKLPDTEFGPTKVPLVTPGDFCTIFNLVIPPTAVDKTCTLEFLFPEIDTTLTPYAYSGGGHFTFTGYAFGSGALDNSTYNRQPPPGPSPLQPPAVLSPGNSYIVNVGGCAIETGMAGLEVSGLLCSPDTALMFVQSDRKCPIGFFVAIS